ncbi:MAG: carboxypeptidase regulatory-like domain-containing protein [Acidobacteria bacterium]|nr:carboxypeptidase regulatory-like domain-containing protein [Acidobacteriota bacterium]
MNNPRNFMVSFLVFLALIALTAGSLGAQEYRARVSGLATDSTQAAVVNAKVTLRNVNTGIETVKETDATGRYLYEFVLPGTYTVTVEASGFSKFVQENVGAQPLHAGPAESGRGQPVLGRGPSQPVLHVV